ncbi:MAG TPA: exodeoxyribonuclease VII small subunit [Ktedonobacterales bacterium]|jgi:exodeoxyribonuclease VII small subunit
MSKNAETEFAGLTFEQAFERLEAAIQALDEGDLSLDDALARFEEGTRLIRYCAHLLETAELQVQQLLSDSSGAVTLAPFESEQ